MSSPYGRLEYADGRVMPGVWLASGNHSGNRWKPYRWRDPAASPERMALAAAIRAGVGDEPDSWDEPGERRPATRSGWLLKGCGTIAAYQRHRRAGQRPCAECTEANRRYVAFRKAEQISNGTRRRAS